MIRKLLSIFFVLFLFACSKDDIEGTDNTPTSPILSDPSPVFEGWIRLKLEEDTEKEFSIHTSTKGITYTGVKAIDEMVDAMGITVVRPVFSAGGKYAQRRRAAGLHLWYDLYFGESATVTKAVQDFLSLPGIQLAEPIYRPQGVDFSNYVVYNMPAASVVSKAVEGLLFNDPALEDQWHYYNDGQSIYSLPDADINLFPAWEITAGSKDVIVAVIDGGVEYGHEDLAANMWQNAGEVGGAANADNDGNGYRNDIYGWNFVTNTSTITSTDHGTHVAGIVSAVNNNGKGVSGIAGGTGNGDGVRIMSCQIFKGDGNSAGDWTTNPEDAFAYAAENGAVIAQNSWGYQTVGYFPESMKTAINYFIDNAGKKPGSPMQGGIVIFASGNYAIKVGYMPGDEYYPGAYEKVVAVASMGPDYRRAYYSCSGNWVDITAPGGSFRHYTDHVNYVTNTKGGILSTVSGGRYAYSEGTSMACPVVSAVAALLVSEYGVGASSFTPDELRAKLLAGVTDIDRYNPFYEGMMGVGYLDSYLAFNTYNNVAPDPVSLSTQTSQTRESIGLEWNVSGDDDEDKPFRYKVFYSTQPLSGLTTGMVPEGVSVTTLNVGNLNVGDPMTVEIEGLSPNKTYNIAIAAQDRYQNYSSLYHTQASTVTNSPPEFNGTVPEVRFYNPGEIKIVDLNAVASDPDGDEVTYSLQYDANIIDASVTDGILAIKSLSFGKTILTVTAEDEMGAGTPLQIDVAVIENIEGMMLYPNPVVDKLNIRMGYDVQGSAAVKIYNSGGSVVLSTSVRMDPLSATVLDLSGLSGGIYTFILTYEGEDFKRSIIKR